MAETVDELFGKETTKWSEPIVNAGSPSGLYYHNLNHFMTLSKKYFLFSNFFMFFIFNWITTPTFAQTVDSLRHVYNSQTIQTSGNAFIVGGNRLKFGQLKPMFMSGITKDLFRKSSSQRTVAGVTTVAVIASLITGAVLKKQDKAGSWAFTLAGIGLNLWSFSLRKRSTEILDRAVWQRNKEILFGSAP